MDAHVNKLEPTCTESGDPLPKQRRLVQRAMNRGQLARKVRCLVGKHNPPHDKVLSYDGDYYIAGPCTECSDTKDRKLVFIGSETDFTDKVVVMKLQWGGEFTVTDASDLLKQIDLHIQYLHS
jgi:hypothetical protein